MLRLVRGTWLLSKGAATSLGVALWIAVGTAQADAYDAALKDGFAARDRARETYDRADWRLAYDHFHRALALSPTAEADFEAAEAAAGMGLIAIAHDHYVRSLERGLPARAAERARTFIQTHAGEVAHLVLDAPEGAAIYVNSMLREAGRGRSIAVPVGAVTIRLELPGYQSWNKKLWAQRAVRHRVQVSLVPLLPSAAEGHSDAAGGGWREPALWTGSALLVAAGGTALTTTVLLSGAHKDLDDHCGVFEGERCRAATPSNLARAQDAADQVETLQVVRLIALPALLLGAGAIVAALTIPHRDDKAGASAHLSISPRGARCLFRGHF